MDGENSMNESNESELSLNRRDALKGMAAASLGIATGAYGAQEEPASPPRSSSPERDLILRENAKPGTRDWQLTKTRQLPGKINRILNNGRCPWIEGYCSANSIRAGEKLQIMVSTAPASASNP